jgi:uncharacterized protein involved in exopolysaccharide biosynthesis
MDSRIEKNFAEQLSFTNLLKRFWNDKWLILFITGLFALASVLYSLSLPNKYRANAVVAPLVNEASAMGLGSQLGGLASLAGVSLGGGGSDKTSIAIEILKSRNFIEKFVNLNNLKPEVMAAIEWSQATNTIVFDESFYNQNEWVREAKNGKPSEPTPFELHKVFNDSMDIIINSENGFIEIAYEHVSPYVAQEIVSKVLIQLNDTMREREINKAQKSIEYLKQQLAINRLAELEAGIFELIQSQTETIMLANASPDYLFQVIDPAIVPHDKSSPKRAIICILGTLLGGVFAIIVVLIRLVFS